ADAIDRKDQSAVAALVSGHRLRGAAADAILAVPDLYGGPEVLAEALARAPTAAAGQALERLAGVLDEFEDMGDLMLDLGMARRLSYYTGVTFRAYTFDFGQPLLGGGRYDGSLLPRAAGFALGLGRVLAAVASAREQEGPAERRGGHGTGGARRRGGGPLVASLDDPGARVLRAAGVRVVRAIAADPDAARAEAVTLGADFMLAPPEAGGSPAERLVALRDDVDPAAGERLRRVLAGVRAGARPPVATRRGSSWPCRRAACSRARSQPSGARARPWRCQRTRGRCATWATGSARSSCATPTSRPTSTS